MNVEGVPSPTSLHEEATVVDAHNDLLLTVAYRRERGDADHFGNYWLPRLRQGGVNVQIAPVFIEDEYRPERTLRRTMKLLELLHEVVGAHPELAQVCTTGAEIDRTLSTDRIAFVPALEGCESIYTDIELVRSMYRLGVRVASLTHFGRTQLADGSALEANGAGLTQAGRDAIAEMERLGIIVDVSHLSAAGTDEVLELASEPVIATHSSCRALRDHHRNLRDDQLRAIAETGGVVGINFFPELIDPCDFSIDRLVDHIEHAVGVAGDEAVGIGPDFVREYFCMVGELGGGETASGVKYTETIEGLESVADLPNLTEVMVRRGFAEEVIQNVLGGSFMRVLRQVLVEDEVAPVVSPAAAPIDRSA